MEKRISKIIKQWKAEAGVESAIQFSYRNGLLTIYTSQCGFLVGSMGKTVNKFREIIKKEVYGFKRMEFIEVSGYSV